ncbi:glycogen-binding domain-containing protein [Thermodesulfobacteriota bacterium]
MSSTTKIKRRRVTFAYVAPKAKEVILMGDFNGWDPQKHPMKKDDRGVWTKVAMIPAGRWEYKFMVDGQWRIDPENDRLCPNRFGTRNNVMLVGKK